MTKKKKTTESRLNQVVSLLKTQTHFVFKPAVNIKYIKLEKECIQMHIKMLSQLFKLIKKNTWCNKKIGNQLKKK